MNNNKQETITKFFGLVSNSSVKLVKQPNNQAKSIDIAHVESNKENRELIATIASTNKSNSSIEIIREVQIEQADRPDGTKTIHEGAFTIRNLSRPTPPGLSTGPNDGPTQIRYKKQDLPQTWDEKSKKNRRFNCDIYDKVQWIEYCKATNKAYCFYCRHFTSLHTIACTFIIGYDDWSHLTQAIKRHNLTVRTVHISCTRQGTFEPY
jgi:hypothetical protein